MNTSLKVLVWILSVIGGFFIVCFLIGMVMSINSSGEKTTYQTSEIRYDIFEKAFMSSCIGEEETEVKREYCQCSFDYMVKEFGRDGLYEEVGRMEKSGASARLTDVMVKASSTCLGL